MAEKPYSRIYHRIMTEYPTVWHSPSQLGTWVQLLVLAEKFYPDPAPTPRRTREYRALVATGLVIEGDTGGYTIKGLEAERERRSDIGRNAAAVRYQRERSAYAVLDEKRLDEKRTEGSNGQAPTSFIQSPARASYGPGSLRPSLEEVRRQHDRAFDLCADCGQRRGGPAHASNQEHQFVEVKA